MIIFYLIGFLLICVGGILLLGLTPESVTDDIMHFISPEQTMRDQVLLAQGKKKSRKLTREILHIKEALDTTGKGTQFTIACALSILLLVVGSITAIVIDNYFLIPVFAIAFASVPFMYIKGTIAAYDKRMKEEMETALSVITISYIRTDDLIGAVKENLSNLRPPVRNVFQSFVGEATTITSDIKTAIRNLKERIDNQIYAEWCDALIDCQDDRALMDTLLPIVSKFTEVNKINIELQTMLSEVKKEYYMMVCLVVGNLPLLYFLNKSWFETLMFSLPGKIVLAVCGLTILVTAFLLGKITKPVEYRR